MCSKDDMEKVLDKAKVNNGEVTVTSDSYKLLQKGFNATLKRTQLLAERWNEKQNKAPKVLRCKKCGKRFKTLSGIKRHFSSKKNECSLDFGYEQVPDIALTPDDLVLDREEFEKVKKFNEIQEAARRVAVSMKKSSNVAKAAG